MRDITAAIEEARQTGELYFSCRELPSLPSEIWELTNLTLLSLSNIQESNLPPGIGQLTNLTQLALSWGQLTMLPPEIGQLKKLRELDLKGNQQLTTLPPEIGQLTNLRELDLGSCKELQRLPPEIGQLTKLTRLELNDNRVSFPEEISQLTKLTDLILTSSDYFNLPPQIFGLRNLRTLVVNDNRLASLPPEIAQLTNLTELSLELNRLESLPAEIGQLTNLTELELNENQLTSLPAEIGQLTNLTVLRLSDNQLESLPKEMDRLTNLTSLELYGNPLPIPPEIEDNTPKEILDYYFQITTTPTRPLNEAKLLVVGQARVGKTSLIKRLLFQEFDPQQDVTHGIERHEWQVGSESDAIRLNVWDFGGQEIMHATHQFFLTQRSLYLLVIDSSQPDRQNRIDYWLRVIESFGGNSPVIIVCNKCDRQQAELDWSKLRSDHSNVRHIAEAISCADPPQGIAELRARIEREVSQLDHVRDPFPENWFAIKNQLAEMQESHLSYKEYEEMCVEQDVDSADDQRRLIGFLHDLGTVLHFHNHPILEAENILNPAWVTKGVYCIVTPY